MESVFKMANEIIANLELSTHHSSGGQNEEFPHVCLKNGKGYSQQEVK
jgi:hypothetical protein